MYQLRLWDLTYHPKVCPSPEGLFYARPPPSGCVIDTTRKLGSGCPSVTIIGVRASYPRCGGV